MFSELRNVIKDYFVTIQKQAISHSLLNVFLSFPPLAVKSLSPELCHFVLPESDRNVTFLTLPLIFPRQHILK